MEGILYMGSIASVVLEVVGLVFSMRFVGTCSLMAASFHTLETARGESTAMNEDDQLGCC